MHYLKHYFKGAVIVHNGVFENSWAKVLGVTPSRIYDTMLIAKRLYPGQPVSLDALTARLLPEISGYKSESDTLLARGIAWSDLPEDVILRRNAADAWATYKLFELMWPQLTPAQQDLHQEDIAIAWEVNTAVKYGMPITHVVLNNDELAKISREQVSALRPVWQSSAARRPWLSVRLRLARHWQG